jgi:hypothetical protein
MWHKARWQAGFTFVQKQTSLSLLLALAALSL